MADLSSLPPGLRGYLAAQQMNQQQGAQQLQGLLGVGQLQGLLTENQLNQLKIQQAVRNQAIAERLLAPLMGGTPAVQGLSSAPLAFGEGGISMPGGQQGNLQTGQTTPAPQPTQAPASPFAGVNPYAAALVASTGNLGELGKMIQQITTEENKPVVNRGYGLGRMVAGSYIPDPLSTQQALAMERAKAAIGAQYAPPQKIPFSGGQTADIFPPEFPAFREGQLPSRLTGQQPQVPPMAPAAIASQPPMMPPAAAPRQPNLIVPPSVQAARDVESKNLFQNEVNVAQGGPSAYPPTSSVVGRNLGTPGLSQSQEDIIKQEGSKAANVEAGKEFIAEMRQSYSKLRDLAPFLENIDKAKAVAAGDAKKFMGPLGEAKLQAAKFLRANVPGMGSLDTSSVQGTEEIRTRLFQLVMDNLKKMDAQPSTYQQQMMEKAFGTIGSDPMAVANILDVFGDIMRGRVQIHNDTVKSAESRGISFPHDVTIRIPEKKPAGGGTPLRAFNPTTKERIQSFDGGNTWQPVKQ